MSSTIIGAVARKLGGAKVLGSQVRSQGDLVRLITGGLPLDTLRAIASSGISRQELQVYVIPQRTFDHRAKKKQPLTVEESDRAVRLVRIQALAEETFDDHEKASRWLRRGLRELNGQTPLDVARTEAGARLVETILAKISWGAAA